MKKDDFAALLVRRDEKQREHNQACLINEEEPHPSNLRRCYRLYDELAVLQQQIDDAIVAEDAAESTEQV